MVGDVVAHATQSQRAGRCGAGVRPRCGAGGGCPLSIFERREKKIVEMGVIFLE